MPFGPAGAVPAQPKPAPAPAPQRIFSPSLPGVTSYAAPGTAAAGPAVSRAPQPKNVWEEIDGVVPVPAPAAAQAAAPPPKRVTPPSEWVIPDATPASAPDPTAIYATPTAAPASSVQGAMARGGGGGYAGASGPSTFDPTGVLAVPGSDSASGALDAGGLAPAPVPVGPGGAGGLGSGALGGGLGGGGDFGALGGPAPADAVPAGNMGVFTAGGPGSSNTGGDTTSVFANGGPASDLPNTYVPSPAAALTTSDLLLKLSLGNSRDQLVPVADNVRWILANATATPMGQVMWYEVVTRNSPTGGPPTVDVTILFKNQQLVHKARQFQILNDKNQREGIAVALARGAQLSVRDMRAVPAVGGGAPVQRDASYGALNLLPPPNTTANGTDAVAAAPPAKSGAAGAARIALAALAGAAALLVL